MRYGELFAGAGGLSMGLDRAGMVPVFHAEIADKPRDILAHRWPDVPLYGDVTTLDGAQLVASHGAIDLLAGGSPCQDMSIAGKREGLGGARSGLFHEQIRIWNETGATYLLWENVFGALSSNGGADFALVLSAIVGGTVPVPSDGWRSAGVVSGPGAVAAWRCLDAQWFGVPQRRLRVFVLGARAGGVDPAEVLLEPQGVRRHPPTRGEAGEGTAACVGVGVASESGQGWWDAESGLAAPLRADPGGMPSHVAYSLNNDSKAGHGDVAASLRSGNRAQASVLAYSIGSHAGAADAEVSNASHDSGGPTGMGISEEVSHTLRAGRTQSVVSFGWQNSASQGDDVCSEASASLRVGTTPAVYSFAENQRGELRTEAIMPQLTTGGGKPGQGYPAICTTGEVTHSLTHEGHDASEDGTGRGTPIIADYCAEICDTLDTYFGDKMGLENQHINSGAPRFPVQAGIPRRLMPIECERLMDWPDQHTNVPDAKGKPASDAVRYKACGNGVVSGVAEWIGERLLAAEAA